MNGLTATNLVSVMNDGISMLDLLTGASRDVREPVFRGSILPGLLRPHHVGLLVPPCSDREIRTVLDVRGFEVASVFRSAVVATELMARYGRPVSVNIYRSCRADNDGPTLEVFHVVEGLTGREIVAAIADIRHIAFAPKEPIDTESLFREMSAEGFDYVGGGVNPDDVAAQNGGVAVLYFRDNGREAELPKIEIVMPPSSLDDGNRASSKPAAKNEVVGLE